MDALSRQSLIDEIVWGKERGAFDDDVGVSLLQVFETGATDPDTAELIFERTRALRFRERMDEDIPFRVPPKLQGQFILGFREDGQPVCAPRDFATQGILLAGNTGSGKSTALTFQGLQWARMPDVSVWLSDMYKTQLRHLRPLFGRCGKELSVARARDLRINPLQTDDRDPVGHAARQTDILASRTGLPPRARTIVKTAILDEYLDYGVLDGRRQEWPCLHDVLVRIESTQGLNAAAREAILDRLGTLLESHPFYRNAWRVGWSPSDLAKYSIVFEMKDASEIGKQVTLETILSSLFHDEIEKGIVNGPLSLVIAFEDSQRFFGEQSSGDGVTPTIIEKAGLIRGTGRALVGLVQTGIGLPKSLSTNLTTRFMGRLGSAEDYHRFGGDMGLTREQIRWAIHHLEPGRFIVQMSDGKWRYPFVAHIPKADVPITVDDVQARESIAPLHELRTVRATEYDKWPARPPEIRTQNQNHEPAENDQQAPSKYSGSSSQRSVISDRIKKDGIDYLVEISATPIESTTARDRRLEISGWKGNNLRTRLQSEGLIKAHRVNPGTRGGSFNLLEVTAAGREYLDSLGVRIENGRGRGGVKHQYWCAVIEEWASSRGAFTKIEDDSIGARVDLTIRLDSRQPVACEIETSSGGELTNVRTDLEAGYETVVTLVESPSRVDLVRSKIQAEVNLTEPRVVEVARLVDFREVLARVLSIPPNVEG